MIVDSVGIALEGDPRNLRDVIGLFRSLGPFRSAGITVVLIDHMTRVGASESHQGKTPFGSLYKGNLSRSRIQVEVRVRGEGMLSVVLRQNEANLGRLADPFGIKIDFTEEVIATPSARPATR